MMPPKNGGREKSILDAFVELADSLVNHYDPLDFLYHLLDHSIPLTGAEAGGVLLFYEGRLHLVASSSEQSEDIVLFELQHNEGPAHDAFRTGEAVRVDRIAGAADRWPKFVGAAAPYGWTSAFAAPLRLRDYLAGSLVVFWSDETQARPNDEDARLLRGLADVATIAVLQRRATTDVEKINEQLHVALEGRIKIEQAKGMIAHATGQEIGAAFEVLRRYSRSRSRPLRDVAGAVVAGHLAIDAIADS